MLFSVVKYYYDEVKEEESHAEVSTHHPGRDRDYLFEEAALRSRLQQMLADTFSSRGYHEVVTPSVEFLDVFTAGGNPLPVEQMYKLTDAKGRLMVMRPDNTTPIARLCASRLKGSRLPFAAVLQPTGVFGCPEAPRSVGRNDAVRH